MASNRILGWKVERAMASLRYAPAIATPFLLVASYFPGRYSVPLHYWVLSIVATLVFIAGRWRPTTASMILAAIAVPLFATEAWGLSDLVPFLGAVALVDAIARGGPHSRATAAGASWAVAVLAYVLFDEYSSVWSLRSLLTVAAFVGLPILLGLYMRGQRELADAFRARAIEAEVGRELIRQQARSDERVALARELHDLVAHQLASIILRSGVAQVVLQPKDEAFRTILGDVHDTASDALVNIRSLLAALRDPNAGDVGILDSSQIEPVISATIDRIRDAGFRVDADLPADATLFAGVNSVNRLAIIRVIQESATNAIKYADQNYPVSFRVSGDRANLCVHMMNRGISDQIGSGYGIAGMSERLHLVGGTFYAGIDGAGFWHTRAEFPQAYSDESGR